jgi:hypothetical protein
MLLLCHCVVQAARAQNQKSALAQLANEPINNSTHRHFVYDIVNDCSRGIVCVISGIKHIMSGDI